MSAARRDAGLDGEAGCRYPIVMKHCLKIIVAIIMAGFALPVSAAERTYSVSDFENIRVVGPFSVTVTPGRSTTAKARGNPLAMDNVSVEVQDKTLTIQPVSASVSSAVRSELAPVAIFITVPRLVNARLSGSGVLAIAELRGAKSDLVLTGSGTISVAKIALDRLGLRLSGAGQMLLTGKALSIEANAKGAGGIEGAKLASLDLKLTASSSGAIHMAASRSASVTSTGSGAIDISGKPACTVQNLGSGTVACGN